MPTRCSAMAMRRRDLQGGGYRLIAESIEFWQGRGHRLHDRLLYRRRAAGGWEIVRLAP